VGSLTVVTAPGLEPIDVDELKNHERVAGTSVEDPLLSSYITAVRRHVEEIAGLALLTQTLEWAIDEFPGRTSVNPWGAIDLPRPPLQSVTSISYTDVDGNGQTVATSVYATDTRTTPGRVTLKYDQEWPDTQEVPHAVVVQYVAGYTTPEIIPEDLRMTLRVLAGTLFEYREDIVEGRTQELGLFRRLLAPYRSWVTV
jgi:uncharacterized phiE125 gp8 family phage protein